MASDIEQRNFVDKDGLEQFWDDIQTYMTRMYKELPSGMQFSRIYQEDGRLHILVEPFGGSTEDRKAASRANLGVYSKAEIDANYKTKQDGVSEQFTEYQTLLDISQDTNGEISVRKQVIPTATVGTLGLTTLKGVVSADDGDNSNAATPKAVADAITAAIEGLDVAELEIGQAKTVGTIEEVDGKIVVTAVPILVDAANIADNAVTSAKIADGTIQSGDIGAGQIKTTNIEDAAVTGTKIASETITSENIQNGTIQSADIGIGQVHTTNIADDAVTNEKVADNAIGTDQIVDGAVTGDKIASDTITSENIQNGTIQSGDIGVGQVTGTNIAIDAVTTEKIRNDAVTNDKVANNAIDTDQIVDGAVTNDKIGHDAVNGDKIADDAIGNEHIADDAVHSEQILDGSVTRDKIADDAVNGDKIADNSIGNEHIADDAVHTEQILDGSVTTGKIANDAVTADKVKDGETLPVNISGNAATATTVEEGSELDQRIGALETGKKDKQEAKADPSTSGNTENFQFISTIAQNANGEITATKHTIPISDSYTLDSSTTLATSAAVKAAVNASHSEVSGLNVENDIDAGEFITSLSQDAGLLVYSTDTMETGPVENSLKPVTGNALYEESHARTQFDDWIRPMVPSAASGQNQLVDKAYVDAIGERLEARYLSSYDAENNEYIPFPTYAAFEAAQQTGPSAFYYNGNQVSVLDNNDIVVITADERHLNEAGGPSTTRYRYQCNVTTGQDGHWYFEYVINNTALNLAQLMAINSGITETLRESYDAHLASNGHDGNPANPHRVTFDQLEGRNGVTSTELGILDGVDTRQIGSDQLNTLTGIHIEEGVTIQSQLDDKVERVSPKYTQEQVPGYTASGKIAIIDDHADVDVRYGVEDSGAVITQFYSPNDTVNPATGSAIHHAIEALEGTHSSTGGKLSITVATGQHGIIDAVTIDDSGLATSEQGAKADTAVQTVTLNGTTLSGNDIDLGNLKTTQDAKTDPEASGETLVAIDSITQNTNGEINATKKNIQSATTSVKGVVQLAGSIAPEVLTENNKAASERAVRDAINDLNVNEIEGAVSKTITSISESSGLVTATYQDIAISKSQVTDFSHDHGNITNDGKIGQDANKVLVTVADGQIVAGNIDDTYSGNNPIATKYTVDKAIAALDSPDSIDENQFVTVVSETDGIIAVTKARPTIGNVNGLTERLEGIDNSLSALDNAKADKVSNAVAGNLASLDANGDLADSGYRVVNTYKVSDDKSSYLANPVTGTAVDAAIAESASSDRQYVDNKIDALDATVATETAGVPAEGKNFGISVSEENGVLTGVSIIRDDTVNAADVSNAINALDATVATETAGTPADGKNFGVSVTETDGVLTGVSIIRDNTINATDLTNAIEALDATVATETADEPDSGKNFGISIAEENGVLTGVTIIRDDTVNATDVSNAISSAVNDLDAEKTSNDGTNVQFKVTEVDGRITAVNVTTDNTVNATDVDTKVATEIGKLDVDNIAGFGADQTLATLTETDGKIDATFQSILVDTANIKPDAVQTAQIADDAVTSDKIKEGEVKTANIADSAVTTTKITDSAVTTAKINDSAVTTAKINNGAVTTDKIYDAAVTSEKIGEGEVKTINIADEAVTTVKIDDDAVTTAKIDDSAVTTAKIHDSAVTTAKIADDAVTNGKIADNAVDTAQIKADAVTTAKIADDAVTNGKIADNAVDTAQIKADAVTTAKIADDAVTNDKIADNAVDTAQIKAGAVTYGKVTNDPENPFPIDISGNASTATHADDASHADVADDVSEGSVLDLRLDAIEETISDLDSTKADKVTGATEGNFAGLDADGNLTDSRVNASTFKTKQTAKTNIGSGLKTATKINQNANGELDVEFSDIQSATTAQKGVVQLVGSIGATVATENNKAASEKAVRDAIDGALENTINSLDVDEVGGAGKYISAISETDGKISATVTGMDTVPTSASTNAVTSGGVYTAINNAVNALDATVSNSSTNVSVSVTETDGKLASITVTDTAATSDHVHGNISNDGKVGTAANKVLVTTTGGEVVAGNIDGTYNASTNKIATQSTVTGAINALDVSSISGFGTDKTLATLTETDGKIAASFQSIQIAESQVTGLVDDLDGIGDSLDTKEDKANKVTSWSATTTDTSYPSEKLVKDSLDTKVDKTTKVNGHALSGDVTVTKGDVGLGNVVNTGDSDTPVENGTTKFTTGGAYTELNKKADKTATVSNVAYDGTNKKITKTINGTTSDVVTAATLKADMALDNVANTNITVSATDGVTDNTNNVTYKYTHPTFTAQTAAAKKVGMDAEGHVVLGDALAKADVGLGNVENTSITVSATDGVKDNTNNVTYKYVHPSFTAKAASAKKVGLDAEGHVVLGDALTKADVGLDLVANQTITVTGTSVSDGTHTFNKYTHPTTTAHAAAAVKVGNDGTGHVVLGDALTKGDVGLSNVDNTSDADKPVSTAQQTALDAKVDKTAGVTSVTWDSTNKKITKTINGTTSDVVTAATLKTAMALNNVTNDAQVKRSEMGVANGVATLGADGKVPSSQLPSYIDDVLEGYYYNGEFYEDAAHTVMYPHESGKVYVDLDTNLTYRWGGNEAGYVKIASDLALGTTHSTAYYGDQGEAAYQHSLVVSGNPHNVTKADVGLGRVNNTAITVSATDGVTSNDGTTSVTYKYTHPAYTVATAAAVKVGRDATGHVTIGAALTKSDVGLGNVVNTGDSATPVEGGTTKFTTGGAYTELAKKADKVTTATEDNFASFDANGNLQDSGHKHSDYKTKQSAKSDPTASGTTITAIDTISQDANGVITATKKTIRSASTSQTGVVQLQGSIGATETENAKAATPKAVRDALDGLVGGLDADVTSTDGTNVQVKVTETDGKITAVNVTTDNTASSTHAHGNITNAGAIGSASGNAVYTTTNGVLTAGSLASSDPTASGNALDFIATVSQDAKGKITATKKTVSTMGAATSSAAGTAGLVPAPGSGKQGSFLRGDGTWQTPTDNKVTQKLLANTTDAEYPVILKNSTTATDSPTSTENYAAGITVNPKNKSVTATKFVGALAGNADTATTADTAKAYDTSFTGTNSIKSALDGKASSTHTHGNITNAGALQTTDVAIANGDKLVITDASNSNKVARTSTVFDGSTTTKALTPKGTFEDFAKQADIDEAIEEIPTISLVGDNHITVTSDDTTGTVTVATDLQSQTPYSAKGTATKVPQITTNALGQVTGITEVTISGVAPAAHTHGSITNDGKIGSTADLAVVTGTSGAVTTTDLTTAAPSASGTGTAFITSVSQDSRGKISASKANLPTASTSASGIVQLAGSIGTTVSSENNKAASEKAVRDAINALDVDSVGGSGKYISAISETNGKISATATTMDTTPTTNSTNAITSGGVASALTGYKPVQTAKTSPSASGSTLAFIDTISQNANGVITATKKNVTVDSSLSTTSTNPVQNKVVNTALSTKVDTVSLDTSIPANTATYVKMTMTGGYHTYMCFFNESLGDCHGQWLLRSYGDGGTSRAKVNIIGGTFTDREWYVEGSDGTVFYIAMPQGGSSQQLKFRVASLDGSTLPSLELVTAVPDGYVQLTVQGVGKAEKLRTARKLAVNLANTSTNTTFDGSADQTSIKVSGTLGIANGGTGATTAKAAEYAINGSIPAATATMQDKYHMVFERLDGDKSSANGVFLYRTAGTVWEYMKGKMSSDTAVNISGNAATATTATNVDLTGSVKTSSTTNGDTIQVKAGSGTAAEITIVNAKHAASADSATKATKDSDGNAINATYFKSSGNVTLVSGSATKIGTQNGADVKLTLPSIPAAVSVKGDAETTYRTGQVNLTPANLGISATTSSVTVGSTTFSKYSHPAGSAPSVTGFPAAGGTLSFGGTFDVNQVTTDSTSHVSSITKRTFTLPSLGTTATTAAKGNHTHATSIAADSTSGATVVSLSANTQYKITAGGTSVIFKTPVDTTYTSKAEASGGTAVSLVTTGEKYTWNHKQDALTEMTTTEVSDLVAAFAS